MLTHSLRDACTSFDTDDCMVEHVFTAGNVQVAILEWSLRRDTSWLFRLDQDCLMVNQAPAGIVSITYQAPISTPSRHQGELSFIPAGFSFERQVKAGRHRAVICSFAKGALFGYDPTCLSERELLLSLDIRNVFLQEAVVRISRELKHSRAGSDLLIDSLCRMLTIEVPRHIALIDWAGETPPDRILSASQIDVIDQRIRAVGTQIPTADELARMCGISVRQFSRLFRRTMGMTVGHYVIHQRISIARRALANGSMSVKAAAFEAGFSRVSAFSVAFRRETGLTPGQFRLIASHSSKK